MSNDSVNSGRRTGRPRKGEPPRISYEELDRLLVFGEVVPVENGEGTTVVYPSYRDLARRFGVSHSVIATYSRKHDCLRRREVAKARVAAKADQKLVELRANAIAMSKDDTLRIIDSYIAGFEKALAEGRVRYDNPTDFNTMVRLKEFILGGADSRQEIHAALSLEDIQARHRRMLRLAQQASAAERGGLAPALPSPGGDGEESERCSVSNPPAPPAGAAPGKVTVHPPGAPGPGPGAGGPHGPACAPLPPGGDGGPDGPEDAPHGPNVGHVGGVPGGSWPGAGPEEPGVPGLEAVPPEASAGAGRVQPGDVLPELREAAGDEEEAPAGEAEKVCAKPVRGSFCSGEGPDAAAGEGESPGDFGEFPPRPTPPTGPRDAREGPGRCSSSASEPESP